MMELTIAHTYIHPFLYRVENPRRWINLTEQKRVNLTERYSERDTVRRELNLLERAQELEGMLAEAKAPRKKERAEDPSSKVSSGEAEQFSKAVEALLQSWHFPNLDRVAFSEDNQDIVISDRPR
ncbi:MAG TPA: hypothetical protein VK186_05160, partial [Candidatus Deferrimicrobium sp.]|nr:hypothetical protein [Candidatus Deferrimicrobium sp.]